ncbi:MAG: hypothetical protein HKN32_03220 [Flavobacteriales bacterium]|nr:hypothetical protein [Flavobacteriales bacterium]
MMKRVAILLLLCAPFMMQAQDIRKAGQKTKTTKTDTKSKTDTKAKTSEEKVAPEQVDKSLMANDNVYIELVVSSGNAGANIKLDLGEYKMVVKDKNLAVALESARAKRYTSAAQALNQLDQLGFEVASTYNLTVRGAQEVHMILKGDNPSPVLNIPERGVGNTMSRENPAVKRQ